MGRWRRDNLGRRGRTPRARVATVESLEARALLASITGVAWQDRDADGVREGGEPGLAGRTVYVDANDNATADAGERLATTGADGTFSFLSLPAGNYTLRQVLPPVWRQTLPATFDS